MKRPIPKIELEPMSAIDLMELPADLLDKVDYSVVKWTCGCKNCNRFTRIRDYGIKPWYWFDKKWIRLDHNYFLCAKHNKYYKRLVPKFGQEAFLKKFFDFEKYKSQST